MRTSCILIALVLWSSSALGQQATIQAQQSQKWEYGVLTAQSAGGLNIPSMWSAGDSSVSLDALVRAWALSPEQKNRANKLLDPLLHIMNELGGQGWEFVHAQPGMGFIFRRPRQP